MNSLLKNLLARTMAKETGGEGSGGGIEGMDMGSGDIDYDDVSGDRGDDFEPEGKVKKDEAEEEVEEETETEAEDEETESEEEDAEDEEAEDDEDEEKEPKAKRDNKNVPRTRLNAEIKKRKEERARHEQEVARLREQLTRDESTKKIADLEGEIDTLEDEFGKLMSDGQTDKAAELTRQIRSKERELQRLESTALTDRARASVKEEIKVETLVEALTEQYPAIDPEADEYDQDVVDMIEGLRSRYIANGQAPSAALKAAASKVLGRLTPAEVEEEETAKGLSPATKPDARRAKAVKKAVAASKAQPAKADVGMDHDKKGAAYTPERVAQMNDDEYEKLPESVKAKARGDFV